MTREDAVSPIPAATTRRRFLKTLALSSAALSAPAWLRAAASGASRPNIVIFLTDDQGYGDLGCYGHPDLKTPNIDAFAREGMRFTDFHSACPVCSPSRSAIQTGRTPWRNGVFRWIPEGSEIHLRRSEITIATLLKQSGYATCHCGKWHLNGKFNSPEHPQPNDHGYDHWFATQNNAHPNHKNPDNFVRNSKPVGQLEGFSAPLVVRETIEWLDKRPDKTQPFFLTVWTHEPHRPIESDPKFMDLYPDLKDPDLRQHRGNISQIDYSFGVLMRHLEKSGARDNTFVVYTSDNGPAGNGKRGRSRGSAGPLRGRKGSVYEGGIRVPTLIRWPGHIQPASQCDQPGVGSDLFNTVCEIAGVAVPTDRPIDGTSIVPAFSGKPIQRPVPMYWRHGNRIVLRDGDWKLIVHDDFTQPELYNLRLDLAEKKNRAKDEPEKLAAMTKRLRELNAEIEAEAPDWWRHDKPRRPRKKAGSDEIPEGNDPTGTFGIVRGARLQRSPLGFTVAASTEAFAVRKLLQPARKRATFRIQYRTKRIGGTRNACLAFGQDPTNDALVKCGTLIGRGTHAIFQGAFDNYRTAAGTEVKGMSDAGATFEAVVHVDLEKRTIRMEVDNQTVRLPLPKEITEIRYVGYYLKDTQSEFSAIRTETE